MSYNNKLSVCSLSLVFVITKSKIDITKRIGCFTFEKDISVYVLSFQEFNKFGTIRETTTLHSATTRSSVLRL